MATEIKMPQLGLTMEEGTVERWLKAEGDPVKAGEPLLEITTDKLTNEVAAETDGVLLKIVAQEGADVPVKGLLGYIGRPGEQVGVPTAAAAPAAPAVEAAAAPNGPGTVLVIGGGPAGMQAALAARFRGHTVDLYEKSDRLGGLLNVACKPPHKEDLGHVTGWFERQLKRAGVGLHLGAALTPEAVRDLGADAVIDATGSSPVFPGFCRKARNAVVAQSILSGEAKAGKKALVIGGGLIGCETAEFLAAQGSDVTILELQPELAKDMESRTRRYLMQRLREYGTRFLTSTQVLEVTEEGKVKAKFPSGSERWLDDFDTLVIAVGYRAENALAAELEEMGCPCVRVGDCASVGKILTAIESGFQAGCSIK